MALIQLNLNTQPVSRRQEKRGILDIPGNLGNIGAIFGWVFGGNTSTSGEIIDDYTALSIADVYAAIRILSNTIGALPLKLYELTEQGRSEAVNNYLYDLLALEPNPEMGAVVFWQTVITCMALTGNAFVYIQRVGGNVDALWPLSPRRTKPLRIPDGTPTGRIVYENRETDQSKAIVYDSEDILHFRLLSLDGLMGIDPLALQKETLGSSRAFDKTMGRVISNAAVPSGIMMSKAGLDEKDLINARESWMAAQSGNNQFKTAFLNGSDWQYIPLSINLEQLEILKARQFTRSQIAAIYGIDPHFLGDTTRMSNTNSEQTATNLVQFTLKPYISQIENEIKRKMLPNMGRKANKFFVQFDVRDLLRGDFKTMTDGLNIARQAGALNADEFRQQLGMNPIPKGVGQVYITPVNYRNAADLLFDPEPMNEELLNAPATVDDAVQAQDDNSQTQAGQRSMLSPLFQDCIGRLLNRDTRDLRNIENVFGPTLRHILALSVVEANVKLGTDWTDEKAEERILADAVKGIEKRSGSWTAENVDQVTQDEFKKALRCIVAGVYRECAASSVR